MGRTEGTEIDGRARWFDRVDAAGREEIRRLHRLDLRYDAIPVGATLAWLALLWVAVTRPLGPFWWPVCAIEGLLLHLMGTFMHEAAHGTLFRRPALDRALGFFCGAFAGFSVSAYETTHWIHHRHVGTDLDSDDFLSPLRPPWLNHLTFWTWPFIGLPVYVVQVHSVALARANARRRVDIAVECLAIAAIFAGAIAWARSAGRLEALRDAWLLSWFVAGLVNGVRGWSEHVLTERGSTMKGARTIETNRAFAFLLGHTNYHLDHHLMPSVPWYRLPRLHAVLEEAEVEAGGEVTRSYARHLWEVLKRGPYGRSPESLRVRPARRTVDPAA